MTAAEQPDPTRTPGRRTPSRWTVLVAGAAVLAVLSPVGWLVSRPAPDAGLPLAEALSTPSPAEDQDAAQDVPSATSEPAAGAGQEPRYGEVTVRDASLDGRPEEPDPAPARLVVEGLGVDAAVDAVGVEDDGSMVIPAEIDRVGWYRFGPAAGAEQGHAVIAGHVDAAGQGPGALFPLREVEVGAVLTVVDEAGAEHRYEVVGRETVVKDVLPVDDIFARGGEHRLVVITCGGPFVPETSSYRDNVVVTAVPVDAA